MIKKKFNLALFAIVILLLNDPIYASDVESESETKSTKSATTPHQTSHTSHTSPPQQHHIIQEDPHAHELRYNGNGALFGKSASLLPVMDSNGRVMMIGEQKQQQQQGHHQQDGYNTQAHSQSPFLSSENSPSFPSLLGHRMRGYPSHFDANLNSFVGDPRMNTAAMKRASENPLIYTNSRITHPVTDADQGPLAPAPKSLMEQAGWWEYLAILFGNAGDSTALRLILHRLTKLAQLQLGPVEAARAQAATAFLAHNFKDLLSDSFRDFVYDPDYTRNSAMWSNDPGFSTIIRRLVDHMDYFGARQQLDSIFGPNTQVALSFGMRQPEWLRLKLILEEISWDLRHPNDLIGLWSESWKLSVPQKLSILAFASNPTVNAPLDLNLPHRNLVLARINLITNGQRPLDMNLIKQQETPLDQDQYHYALLQATGSLCKKQQNDSSSGNSNSNSSSSANSQYTSSTTTPSAASPGAFKKRVGDYCELVNLTPNFVQFCQSGPNDSTPLASLLSAAGSLFDQKVIKYINHLERLFWAFTWSGSCMDAREALATLTDQIKVLTPKEHFLKKGERVPSDVADSTHIRLEYMQAVQQACQNNLQLTGSADVAHIFSLLNYGHLHEALMEWERRFSAVAARLQGFPGGSVLVGGEGQLLYQQARDVRIALLIYKYPRSVYVPCLSRGLLTRDPSTDLTLLNLTHSLDTADHHNHHRHHRTTNLDPMIPQMSARSLYMRALYLSGLYVQAAGVAREISSAGSAIASEEATLVQEFLACTQLCGSATRNPCEAEKTYNSLISNGHGGKGKGKGKENPESNAQNTHTPSTPNAKAKDNSSVVYRVGHELSSRLCKLSRNTAADALSLRYGKLLTTQATFSAFKRIIQEHYNHEHEHEHDHHRSESKLHEGKPESILPWFGTLPPAPIEEILSFVPSQKLNFVAQVGISGVPLIKGSGSTNSSAKATGNGKIFVLGKEYDANYLTASNGHGNTQPKTSIKNGYFQLQSDTKAATTTTKKHPEKDSETASTAEHEEEEPAAEGEE